MSSNTYKLIKSLIIYDTDKFYNIDIITTELNSISNDSKIYIENMASQLYDINQLITNSKYFSDLTRKKIFKLQLLIVLKYIKNNLSKHTTLYSLINTFINKITIFNELLLFNLNKQSNSYPPTSLLSSHNDSLHPTSQLVHQPNSTLLLLIASLVGDNWREIYQYALKNNYRFLSYGDSSLLLV